VLGVRGADDVKLEEEDVLARRGGPMTVGAPVRLIASAEAWLKTRRDQSCEKKGRRARDAGVMRRGEEQCACVQHEGQVL